MTTHPKKQSQNYLATQEELRIIDAAIASIDDGKVATNAEIKAAFAKFRLVSRV
jgi:hypothetical protein